MIAKLKNLSGRKKAALIAAFIISALCAARFWPNPDAEWIDIGKGGPRQFEKFPYRLIELIGKETLPKTHPDLTALTMSLQRGGSLGAWVYLPIYHCYAPSVRDGLPTVQCESLNNSDVVIAANDNVREALMRLERHKTVAAVQGRARGLYADIPIIWVVDPSINLEQPK
nr:hypothetical protein [Herbaspirillum sp. ASV7]